ncbi:NmrA family NAD(P)-binding protein [Nocardia sp. BSTN01]|uniref:NmrA family NAD(P)-binding protein n=1 Tax=Nocardia sp. BSTN01 TaxID=2783665 RepID=UPI00189070D8|nr:NmrA family NAD(P)-binding protein [Nocardia sp. BSTN01]MBF5000393.1 NmrA family NAD(P)-binding protein [Nocardia sp. BSTN01]
MILLTGYASLLGAAVVREFAEAAVPVRVLVDHVDEAAALAANGIQVVLGCMARPDTLVGAFEGVDRVFVLSAVGFDLIDVETGFIQAAVRAGVGYVVKLSNVHCNARSPYRTARMHAEVERMVEDSGLAWTRLRPSQFMQTYFHAIPSLIHNSELESAIGNARMAPVDIDDVAKVVYRLLTTSGHEGKRYTMTGPEALTVDEIAQTLSILYGKPIYLTASSPNRIRTALLNRGVASALADDIHRLVTLRREGSESHVDLSAHAAVGIQPTTFATFAQRNANTFYTITSTAPRESHAVYL